MRSVAARNVNEAYENGLYLMGLFGVKEDSRNGPVIVMPEPYCTDYQYPLERVLFDRKRKANPFFHLFEAMWMLAGRNDATWLDQFVHDFSARYAEPNGKMYGAYGYRWRHQFNMDQLAESIRLLKADHNTRQVVIQMWAAVFDLGAIVKDKPCNTHIYFRIRNGALEMTVCCRSNDMIWGAYGANAVHFSFLHEYIALCVGVEVGSYYQISNNMHVYQDTLDRLGGRNYYDPYLVGLVSPTPLIAKDESPQHFLEDIGIWCDDPVGEASLYEFVFIEQTLIPMYKAHQLWKATKNKDAVNAVLKTVAASDWRLAAMQWIGDR
jgi:hypothetical protein